jgi:hypothetical protein
MRKVALAVGVSLTAGAGAALVLHSLPAYGTARDGSAAASSATAAPHLRADSGSALPMSSDGFVVADAAAGVDAGCRAATVLNRGGRSIVLMEGDDAELGSLRPAVSAVVGCGTAAARAHCVFVPRAATDVRRAIAERLILPERASHVVALQDFAVCGRVSATVRVVPRDVVPVERLGLVAAVAVVSGDEQQVCLGWGWHAVCRGCRGPAGSNGQRSRGAVAVECTAACWQPQREVSRSVGRRPGSKPRAHRSSLRRAVAASTGVAEVVLSTFDELVIKNDNDVLLEVYVPGCPACGALMPRIAMLSTLLKAVPTVTIAAMVGAAVMAYAVCLSVYAVAMLFRC